jgi:hypothetical protein
MLVLPYLGPDEAAPLVSRQNYVIGVASVSCITPVGRQSSWVRSEEDAEGCMRTVKIRGIYASLLTCMRRAG